MKFPICTFDVQNKVLCPACESKIKKGEVSQETKEILFSMTKSTKKEDRQINEFAITKCSKIDQDYLLYFEKKDIEAMRQDPSLYKLIQKRFQKRVWPVETILNQELQRQQQIKQNIDSSIKDLLFPIKIQVLSDIYDPNKNIKNIKVLDKSIASPPPLNQDTIKKIIKKILKIDIEINNDQESSTANNIAKRSKNLPRQTIIIIPDTNVWIKRYSKNKLNVEIIAYIEPHLKNESVFMLQRIHSEATSVIKNGLKTYIPSEDKRLVLEKLDEFIQTKQDTQKIRELKKYENEIINNNNLLEQWTQKIDQMYIHIKNDPLKAKQVKEWKQIKSEENDKNPDLANTNKPSTRTDRQILGTIAYMKSKDSNKSMKIIFFTLDHDFIIFQKEIKQKFDIKVETLQ